MKDDWREKGQDAGPRPRPEGYTSNPGTPPVLMFWTRAEHIDESSLSLSSSKPMLP